MKREWNSPAVQELTIKATAKNGWHHDQKNQKPSDGKTEGGSNTCRCQGGTSPCQFHHGWGEDEES